MGTKVQKMLDSARGQACISCGAKDGTVVAAHYQGYRSHMFGKGTGTKPSDLFIAHLCSTCHQRFDSYGNSVSPDKWVRKIENSEVFLYAIAKTWERLYQQGKIVIK